MRPKSLIAEIEAIFDERQEQIGDGASPSGPHLNLNLPKFSLWSVGVAT